MKKKFNDDDLAVDKIPTSFKNLKNVALCIKCVRRDIVI